MVLQNKETSRQHRESAKKSHQTAPINISLVIRRQAINPLNYRGERTNVIQLFKIIHGFDTVSISSTCPICNNPMFKLSLATQTRVHPYKFQVQHTSGHLLNFFSTRVLDNWNKLSTKTVTSTTVNMFKSRLTKEWQNKPDLYQYLFSYKHFHLTTAHKMIKL